MSGSGAEGLLVQAEGTLERIEKILELSKVYSQTRTETEPCLYTYPLPIHINKNWNIIKASGQALYGQVVGIDIFGPEPENTVVGISLVFNATEQLDVCMLGKKKSCKSTTNMSGSLPLTVKCTKRMDKIYVRVNNHNLTPIDLPKRINDSVEHYLSFSGVKNITQVKMILGKKGNVPDSTPTVPTSTPQVPCTSRSALAGQPVDVVMVEIVDAEEQEPEMEVLQ